MWRRTTTRCSALPRTRRRRHQEGVPQAGPPVPPRREQGATRRPRRSSRRSPRPTTSCPTTSGARSTTRPGRCSAAGLPGCRPGGGGFPFDLGDLLNNQGGAGNGGLGDLFGGLFNRGRAPGQPGPTTAGVGRRGSDIEAEASLSASCTSIDGVTIPLRMTSEQPCTACSGSGAKAGTTPRVCPTCSGTGHDQHQPGRLRLLRALPRVQGARPGGGRPRARLQRLRTARSPPGRCAGQDSLGGQGRPADPAQGQGRSRRARRPSSGDLYVVVHVKPHAVFGREGDNLTVDRAGDLPRGGAGRRRSRCRCSAVRR
jgi:DnaJ-class molecular chaperone